MTDDDDDDDDGNDEDEEDNDEDDDDTISYCTTVKLRVLFSHGRQLI